MHMADVAWTLRGRGMDVARTWRGRGKIRTLQNMEVAKCDYAVFLHSRVLLLDEKFRFK